jgi:hypothetical protein
MSTPKTGGWGAAEELLAELESDTLAGQGWGMMPRHNLRPLTAADRPSVLTLINGSSPDQQSH